MTPGASISVVVPCYNAERWVAGTLASVLAQDSPVHEVIVVDDGSTDRSTAVIRERFPGVTVVQQANSGVAAARNAGIRRASGQWIAFVDADDYWLPGKLSAQREVLRADPSARMACTAWQVWPSAAETPDEATLQGLRQADTGQWRGPSGWIYADLLLDCHVWTSTVLVHRSLLDEIGLFDPGLRIGEDYDLWLRAARVTPILRVPRPLALYRMHPGSLTKAAPMENHQGTVVARAVARWGYGSPDGARARKADVDRAIARTWSDFAGAHLAADNLERARYGALMSLRARWCQVAGWKLLARNLARSLATYGRRP
ncbi:MAG: glycosyltransferase [Burkholderiales bacterium]